MEKWAYPQGWSFESKTYEETWNMFEIMEVSKQVYKVEAHYKIFNRAYTNRAGRIKNKKGVEATSTSNPENFRSGKLKNRDAGNRIIIQP